MFMYGGRWGERCGNKEGDLRFEIWGGWLRGPVVYCSC